MTNDLPIHLPKDSIKVPVYLTQNYLDGLCALIHFCDGMAASGKGRVPGSFELVMHYRQLRDAVHNTQDTGV